MLRKVKLWIKRRVHGIVTVEELRKNGAVIGNNVELWSNKIDKGHAFLLEIGNNVTISDARILLHDGSTKIFLGYSKVGKVVIGDNVFIGADAIILPGTKIGSNVVIGAGAVVKGEIPSDSIVVGIPGKVVCTCAKFIDNNKKLLETCPRYETYWPLKTTEEKEKMKIELADTIGFDI